MTTDRPECVCGRCHHCEKEDLRASVRKALGSEAAMARMLTEMVDRSEKAEAEVARLRAAIDKAVSTLTPEDVSRIKRPGFMALLELSGTLREGGTP